MGGLWVDYQLMSSIPGLFVLGEANYSEHGANRLGASALMQGLADGYFIAPSTVTAWLAGTSAENINADHPACREALDNTRTRINQLLNNNGSTPVDSFHRELGSVMIDRCGIGRHADGLQEGLKQVKALEQRFEAEVRVPGDACGPNAELESPTGQRLLRAGPTDAAGCPGPGRVVRGHPRGASERRRRGPARRRQLRPHRGLGAQQRREPTRHSEPLQFTALQPSTRSYK